MVFLYVLAFVCVCVRVPAEAGDLLPHGAREGASPIRSPLISPKPLKSRQASPETPRRGEWTE